MMSEWISVKDRLPEEGIPVIVCYLGYYDGMPCSDSLANIKCGGWCWWEGYDCDNDEEIRVDVTHWMMLPDPPKEDIGE